MGQSIRAQRVKSTLFAHVLFLALIKMEFLFSRACIAFLSLLSYGLTDSTCFSIDLAHGFKKATYFFQKLYIRLLVYSSNSLTECRDGN